jgi:hypothetical protein
MRKAIIVLALLLSAAAPAMAQQYKPANSHERMAEYRAAPPGAGAAAPGTDDGWG